VDKFGPPLQRRNGLPPGLDADVRVAGQHSVVYMSGQLADGLDGHGWIFCQPGHKGVARIVKTARNPAFSPRGFECALVAPLAHRAIQVNVPDERFAAVAGEANTMKRESITVQPGIGKTREPNRKRVVCAICQRDDSSRSTVGLRPRDDDFTLGNRTIIPAQRQIAPAKGAALRRPKAGIERQNEKRIQDR